MSSKAKTIKDVAKHANVSIATVSRVLSNSNNVSPSTVEKVNKAILECNFIPNNIARNLKQDISKTIGYVVSDISNPYYMFIAKVLESYFRPFGYNIMISSTGENKEQELSCLNQLLSNRVAGIIINTTGKNNPFIVSMSKHTPTILLERYINSDEFIGDYVGSDNSTGIKTLTETLIENGHKKIAFINGSLNVSTGKIRYASFIDTLKLHHINYDTKHHINADTFDELNGYNAAQYLLSQTDKPTAIIVANNSLAIGALKYFKASNISIPNDISFASYGSLQNIELFFVETSLVYYDPKNIGDKLCELLSNRINNPCDNQEAIFMPVLRKGVSIKNIS